MTLRHFVSEQFREALLGSSRGLVRAARMLMVAYFALAALVSVPQYWIMSVESFR